jgi:EF-hand domain pair
MQRMKKQGVAALLVAAVVAGAGVAVAQPGGDREARHAERMAQFDTNKNGTLEPAEREAMRAERRAEAEARHKELLARYDANRDGTLDDAERTRLREERAAERFKKLDTNGDGSLSLAEFQAGAKGFGHGRRGHHGRR